MADSTPYSDELEDNRPEVEIGSEPETGAEGEPVLGHLDTPVAETTAASPDAEPSETDTQTIPTADEAAIIDPSQAAVPDSSPVEDSAEEDNDPEIDEDLSDDEDDADLDEDFNDDEFDVEEDDSEIDQSQPNVDDEPNDTDSQVIPPYGIIDEDDDQADEDSDELHEMEAGMSPEQMAGTVTLVGVPIGNRDDITFRALHVLQMADLVVCEEYKTAARLLRNYNISKKLIEMNEHNEDESSDEVIELIRKGKKIAVISDAGLPVLADPGNLLSSKLRKLGVEPKIVPGVSSVMTGLMASGYAMDRFEFIGFLPRKPEERSRAAAALASRDTTLVILEAPYRLRSLLAALSEAMPDRRAALAINLTTSFETTIRGTLAELDAKFAQKRFKGEFVVVLDRLVPTDLGISTTAGFDPNAEADEFEEEREEQRVMDAGERPIRRTPARSGEGRPERSPGGGIGPSKYAARSGDRSEQSEGRREGPREDRPHRGGERRDGGGFASRREDGGNRGFAPRRDDRGGRGFSPRGDGGGGRGSSAPRRDGGDNRGFAPRREDGGSRGFAPKREDGGSERSFSPRRDDRGGSRGFAPRGDGGGGRSFSPRRDDRGGSRGFAPRGDGGGSRGFAPKREDGGSERSFSPRRDDRGGSRGFAPRGDGGGSRGFAPKREDGGSGRSFTPRRDDGGSRGFAPRGDGGSGGGRSFGPRGGSGGGGNRGFSGGPKGRSGGNRGFGSKGGGRR